MGSRPEDGARAAGEAAALEAAFGFALGGRPVRAEVLVRGRIHESFVVTAEGSPPLRSLLQRLNTAVFPDPSALMANVARVSAHLARRAEAHGASGGPGRPPRGRGGARPLRVPTPLRARSGGYLVVRESGVWRAFGYLEHTRPASIPPTPKEAEEAGLGFGSFLALVDDLPGPPLVEVLPFFHDLGRRTGALVSAARRDACGRLEGCAAVLEEALELVARVRALGQEHGAFSLPTRIVHNDAKLDNALFDATSGEVVAVVDLDTVMPGSLLADVGDLLRSAAATVGEDEPPPSPTLPLVDLDRLRRVLGGFLGAAGELLTPAERDALAVAGPLLALEQGVRFLTDHLEGDRYFPVSRPSENRDRAVTQLRLCRELLGACDLVADLVAGAGR